MSEIKEKKKPTIIIDNREGTPWVFSEKVNVELKFIPNFTGDYCLEGFEPIKVNSKDVPHMESCPYDVSNSIIIERKSTSDLIQSITPVSKKLKGTPADKRLKFFKKLNNLSHAKEAWIIIEGGTSGILNHNYNTNINTEFALALTRQIIMESAKLNIPMWFASNRKTAAHVAENILTSFWRKHVR
jgi:ERCC4-type nuclease